MSNKDFQNGFALGLASGGIVESEGIKLNIAYGETAPEDTSKLWIKANEPANVSVGSDINGVESVANVGYLPSVEYGMSTARVGNKIYLFGGKTSVNFNTTYLNTIRVYDIETNTLTTLETTLPTPCEEMGCASVGTKIYLFGGKYYTGSWYYVNTINVFDTETNTITTLSTTTSTSTNKYYSMGCVANGTKIYLFGGSNQSSIINTINVFDTETEIFTTLSTTLPKPNYSMGCTSVGAKIYLFGGWTNSGGYLNTISVFDVNTNTITTLNTTLPQALHMESCAFIGTKIYLFGGYNGTAQNTIYEFDTETEEVITLEAILPTACYSMGCSAYGNKVYLFGGYGSSALNTINCFSVGFELAHNNLELQTGSNNKFNLINTESAKVKIGVENVYIGNENNEADRVDAYLHNGTEWVQI